MRKTSNMYKNAIQKTLAVVNNKMSFSDMATSMSNSIIEEKKPEVVLAPKQPEFEDNTKKAEELAAKLVLENPENALKVLET
jgi:hypothetical protein